MDTVTLLQEYKEKLNQVWENQTLDFNEQVEKIRDEYFIILHSKNMDNLDVFLKPTKQILKELEQEREETKDKMIELSLEIRWTRDEIIAKIEEVLHLHRDIKRLDFQIDWIWKKILPNN